MIPLIAYVEALGMDFGLWVEPEMVSPESDLYRAHPDWCVHLPDAARATMRGQLTLDLSREEVCYYLFGQIDALLRAHPIAYLKWDHNRDLFPAHQQRLAQTQDVYALLDRLRAAHPKVEIESCSSGGGRIDYGILTRTHRVCAQRQQRCNRAAADHARLVAIPAGSKCLEAMSGLRPIRSPGACSIWIFRAKVALFGHMGVEADPRAMSDEDRAVLSAHIALYKDWREVLQSGELHQLEHPDPGISGMIVSDHHRALAIAAQTGFAAEFDASPRALERAHARRDLPCEPAKALAEQSRELSGQS